MGLTDKIERLKSIQRDAERARGRADVAIQNLKQAGYETRQSAVAALASLGEEIEEKQAKFDADYAAFSEEWAEQDV